MTKTIACFGDSNTYGWDPRSFTGTPYPHPWPSLLEKQVGFHVENLGLPGRCIPRTPLLIDYAVRKIQATAPSLVLIMLGTNDLVSMTKPDHQIVCDRMERFLEVLLPNMTQTRVVLLELPPILAKNPELVQELSRVNAAYSSLAEKMSLPFLDCAHDLSLMFDGLHLTEDAHRKFAAQIATNILIS